MIHQIRMTEAQQLKYLRRVLRIIAQRRWKNGCLVDLARTALLRIELLSDRLKETRGDNTK